MLNGLWTVAELKDLLKAKDDELSRFQKSYDGFKSSWQGADADAWTNDWNALNARYKSASDSARAIIAINAFEPMPDSMIPADDSYKAVLQALQQTSGVTSPGDFQDLADRLSAALAAAQQPPVDDSNIPQPTATDVDLSTLQTVTTAAKAVDSAAAAASNAAKSAVSSSIAKDIAIGAGILLVGMALLRKLVMPF